jgi:hypothetical protein
MAYLAAETALGRYAANKSHRLRVSIETGISRGPMFLQGPLFLFRAMVFSCLIYNRAVPPHIYLQSTEHSILLDSIAAARCFNRKPCLLPISTCSTLSSLCSQQTINREDEDGTAG